MRFRPRALLNYQFSRYVIASGIALGVDYVIYWLLASITELSLPVTAVIGYSAGLIVAYVLLSGRVFKNGWLRRKRYFEILLFAASGLFGIFITYGSVVVFIQLVGERVHWAKLFAISVSFFSVYVFRKILVFRIS